MSRLTFLLVGIVLGAALSYGALRYHLVRAQDGWHAIPRTAPTLEDSVVDVRGFGVAEWNAHRTLGYAIVRSGRTGLLHRSAVDDLQRTMGEALRGLFPGEGAAR